MPAAEIDLKAITFRPLTTDAEYAECVKMQAETWGTGFNDVVPPQILMICQRVGGVVAGAFGPDGRLLGFVLGLTGIKNRRPAHWSHMLAVRSDIRGTGLGQQLKRYQRELLLKMGVDLAYWTFDPLVSRNAHLNLNRLGARIDAYVPDYYGPDTGSELHSGLGTDRFIVVWQLRDARVKKALAGRPIADYRCFTGAPVVDSVMGPDGVPVPEAFELPAVAAVRVEVPPDIHAVKLDAPETAWQWRAVTRRAFLHYLGRGYRVEGIYREGGRSFYVVAKSGRRRRAAGRSR